MKSVTKSYSPSMLFYLNYIVATLCSVEAKLS